MDLIRKCNRGESNMLKKVIACTLILGLIILVNPTSAVSVEVNGSSTQVFSLDHTVKRISNFKAQSTNTDISEVGENKIGTLTVQNNTRDGFSVTIASEQGGVLHSATDLDGETDLEYSVLLEKSTGVGKGGNIVEDKLFLTSDLEPGVAVSILDVSDTGDGFATSATDLEYDIFVDIDSGNEDQMGMAGSYTDVLTLVYTDK